MFPFRSWTRRQPDSPDHRCDLGAPSTARSRNRTIKQQREPLSECFVYSTRSCLTSANLLKMAKPMICGHSQKRLFDRCVDLRRISRLQAESQANLLDTFSVFRSQNLIGAGEETRKGHYNRATKDYLCQTASSKSFTASHHCQATISDPVPSRRLWKISTDDRPLFMVSTAGCRLVAEVHRH